MLFIFISFELLIASSGVIFLAFLAADKQDKYTVTKPSKTATIIGITDILKTILASTTPFKIFLTITTKIYTAFN